MSKPMTHLRAHRLRYYLWKRLLRIQDKYSPPPLHLSLRRKSSKGVLILFSDLVDMEALKGAYDHYVRLCLLLEQKLKEVSC